MRAIQVEAFGGPEALVLRELPEPTPGRGQVVIDVATTNVNFADVHTRSGHYRRGETLPFVPGLEAAGTVSAVGEGVTTLQVGQRVAAFAAGGSYAERIVASERLTYPLPDAVSFEAASALTAAITAFNVLRRVGKLATDDVVLIHAAAGGVGLFAVQLAALHGARRVLAAAGDATKRALVLEIGAHDALDSRRDDLADEVLRLTEGAGADLVLDSVAGRLTEANLRCLADFGRIVSFGQASGEPGKVTTDLLYRRNLSLLGYSSGHYRKTRPEFLRPAADVVLDHLSTGALRTFVSATFPLAEAAEAHRLVESRRSHGKVLLVP